MENQNKINILILDDEKQFTEELHEFFQNSGYTAIQANTVVYAREILANQEINLLVLDIQLQGANGLDILKEVRQQFPAMEVIIVSGHGDMDTVIKALRLGAFDYLQKPFRHVDIQIAIERTQKYLQIRRQLMLVEKKFSLISRNLQKKIDREFIGCSPQIQEVYRTAINFAEYPDTNVMITGESGTGKENIARIIHYTSDRKDNIFFAVNCSAIVETIWESEFFGHKKGAFTGADTEKIGFFELADKGTLFLDEIADMPLPMQAKILRVLEEKVITRVGDTKLISTHFRVIVATNHDVEKMENENKFRRDLLHRLNTLHIHIPALRERPEDIKPLLTHFVEYYTTKFNKPNLYIAKDVFEALMQYDFPGNVRELKNMAERAIILCKGTSLKIADFPIKPQKIMIKGQVPEVFNLKDNEIILIRKALQICNYNQCAAAELLGITRDALNRKMKKYSISISKSEE